MSRFNSIYSMGYKYSLNYRAKLKAVRTEVHQALHGNNRLKAY